MSNKWYQKDRVYSLVVGDKEDAVEINNLQIKFSVTKTSSNADKKNKATVEIYNLSESRRKALEKDYVQVELRVGYAELEMETLFTGQVVNISNSRVHKILSKKDGANVVTKLEIDELYTSLNHSLKSKIVPEGSTVREVILSLISDIPEVTRHEMNGNAIERVVEDGYPIHGAPKSVLDNLSKTYDIEWSIDSGVLYVSDRFKSYMKDTSKVPLIGQMSGLIEAPEFVSSGEKRKRQSVKVNTTSGDTADVEPSQEAKKKGNTRKDSLKMKILLNPALIAGSIFKLDFGDLTGYYKIDEVTHKGDFRGRDWYSEIMCSEKLD